MVIGFFNLVLTGYPYFEGVQLADCPVVFIAPKKKPADFDASNSFAVSLRRSTEAVHRRAEKATFIRGFLRGTTTRDSYTRLLAALHPVYHAMEDAARRLGPVHPVLARLNFEPLYRAEAVERDLIFLAGENWATTVRLMPASEVYVRRIRAVADAEPLRLIGHFYTRYMGDLSGGQILARIAGRSLGLSVGAGLDFYDFPEVDDVGEMKRLFRARLDELGALSDAETNAVIDEALIAFRLNIALFDQLEGNGFISFLHNLPLPWARAAQARPFHAAAS